jgi:membrane protein
MNILERVTPPGRWRRMLHYLGEIESHVYALAISASVLLSFYPFMRVMLYFCRDILHWRAAVEAIYLALHDFFPGELGDFLVRQLRAAGGLDLTSMLLLLFTANGVFEPLEVALNKAWGVTENRSYIQNQLVSLGMIFLCGALALLSLMLTAMNKAWIVQWALPYESWIGIVFFKLAAVPFSILGLFLIYWLLPHHAVPARQVVPVAIIVGLILEVLKYVHLLLAPVLAGKLQREYEAFQHSAAILLASFVGSMVVLAGAYWTAREGGRQNR